MKKTIIRIAVITLSFAAAFAFAGVCQKPVKAATGVEVNETNFPDEVFRNWVLKKAGEDGILSESEANSVVSLYMQNESITDLKGIEYFKRLSILNIKDNKLTHLDLSKNTALTDLDCSNNLLEELNICGCTALKRLSCSENPLTSLDLSSNVALETLLSSQNQITELDFSNNPALISVYSWSGKLTSIDVSKNTALKSLSLYNNQLRELDVSNNTALVNLDCRNNLLTEIDLSKNTALKKIEGNNNQFNSIDVSSNLELEKLHLSKNNLSSLDVSKNTTLKSLDCSGNNLTSLDVSNNTSLEGLYCDFNLLTVIDVGRNLELVELSCSSNNLTDVDVSKNVLLKELECSSNQLTDIDVSRNLALKRFYCASNPLTVLDLTMNENVFDLDCHDAPIDTIYIFDIKSYGDFWCDVDADWMEIKASDWKFTGVQWVDNYADPSKTTAYALFDCTKEGATDYKVASPMDVTVTSLEDAACEKDGSASYVATLPAEFSRTRTEITDENSIVLPAKGHEWGAWKVTTKATVISEGEETRACKNDPSHKETRKIAKLTPTPTAKPTVTPTNKPVANVTLTLNKKDMTIVCGRTDSLKATLKGATGKISWKSTNSKVASVDANGKITGKQAGTVVVTATAAGKSASCTVTVLYKDVTNPKDFWYVPTNYLTAKGVVKGYDKQTKFKPANDCTRAQMVTFLYRLQGEPKTKSSTCKFKDVKKTDYFFKPVIWAVEKGITTGVSKEKFNPQGVCTRAQTVTFLWRMAGKPEPGKNAKTFPDVKKTEYYYKATLWASDMKILAGLPDGTFNPQGKCLRRQMVTFLYKYDKFVNKKG